MISLGIESTAHTFGVGIVEDGKILSDERDVFIPPKGSGIHPKLAAEHHIEVAPTILKKALEGAGLKLKDVDIISFSQGPGLPPCLQVGLMVAKTLHYMTKKPLIGVNHCIAHIEIGRLLTGAKDPVVLYISGGNTQVISYSSGRYRVFGETEDIPIGNALDVFARKAGLGYPGGPKVEQLAKKGKYVELPYVVKGMDLSFTGIVTDALRKLEKGIPVEDLAFSLQETMFSMLAEVSERAMAQLEKKELLVIGGVAANRRLKEMLEIMTHERGGETFVVPMKYAGDNGTMIAHTGLIQYKSGWKSLDLNARFIQKWRTDDVKVTWI